MKTIYCYFNEDDIKSLLLALSSNGIHLYDSECKRLHTLPYVSCGVDIEIELYDETRGQVLFSPCWVSSGYLQCGMFWLKESDDSNSNKLYSTIKKYVRRCFVYSKNSACYYGNGFFNEWRNGWTKKEYCLPVLLECDKCELEDEKIDSLCDLLKKVNMDVKPNRVRLRDMNKVELNNQDFIIYYSEDPLLRTIVRKSFVRYEYGSACIFAYKNEKKRSHTLYMDSRLIHKYPHLEMLFEQIKHI